MSYQALLFCPDEKTARVVSQVLSDLEFSVEPCNEPFAAVKKLMGQHFDAIVVDCDNEQNAALLFKSARNSDSNQASLAVAVVEGQAGVAKAFRLGANLVLTKPIHVEQSKGTLRVARGLLRKGQTAKPAGSVSTPAAPVAARQQPSSLPSVSATSTSVPHCLRLRCLRRFHHTQPLRRRVPALPPSNLTRNLLRSLIPSTQRCSNTCRTLLRRVSNRRLRLIPVRPSSMPGSHAPSPWRSRWPRPCAGPRKLREKLSTTNRRRATPPLFLSSSDSGQGGRCSSTCSG